MANDTKQPDAIAAKENPAFTQSTPAERAAYLRGMIAGMTRASRRIGWTQVVGNGRQTLAQAIEEVEAEYRA